MAAVVAGVAQLARAEYLCSAATAELLVLTEQTGLNPAAAAVLLRAPLARVALVV
jgi:hypothetical protein